MRISILLTALFALMLAVAAPAAADPNDVPFNGTDTYAPDLTKGVIDCGAGLSVPRVFQSQGEWTPLGKTSAVLTADSCQLTATGLIIIHGHATRTFTNGQVFVSWVSIYTPVSAVSFSESGEARISGGTGAFEHATADFPYTGKLDLSTLTGQFTVSGTMLGVGQPSIAPPATGSAGLASDDSSRLYAGIALIIASVTGATVLFRSRA
jgi:hypothetical protein